MKVWKLFTLYSFISGLLEVIVCIFNFSIALAIFGFIHTAIAIILFPISLIKDVEEEEEEFWRRY